MSESGFRKLEPIRTPTLSIGRDHAGEEWLVQINSDHVRSIMYHGKESLYINVIHENTEKRLYLPSTLQDLFKNAFRSGTIRRGMLVKIRNIGIHTGKRYYDFEVWIADKFPSRPQEAANAEILGAKEAPEESTAERLTPEERAALAAFRRANRRKR